MNQLRCARSRWLLVSSMCLALACSEDEPAPADAVLEGEHVDAVVVGVWVRGADTNQTYLVASDEAPNGELDLSNALELPDGTLTSDGHAVYFTNWELSSIDRYEVGSDYSMKRTGRMSLASHGVPAPLSWHILFFSDERAFYVDPTGEQILVWNPSRMEIEETLAAPELAKEGFGLQLGKSHRVGDTFVVSALRSNEEDTDIDRKALALIFQDDASAPVRVLEDDRCPGTRGSFVDEAGDVYVLGDGYGGYLAMGLGVELPKPCMLRIRRGATQFDADYQLDLAALTRASAMQGLWHVEDRKFVVQVWPENVSPASVIEEPDDFWSAEVFQWKQVDLDGEEVTDIQGIEDSAPYQLMEFQLDGVTHLLKHEEDESDAGRSALFALDAAGRASEVASTRGDFWFLGRIGEAHEH